MDSRNDKTENSTELNDFSWGDSFLLNKNKNSGMLPRLLAGENAWSYGPLEEACIREEKSGTLKKST